MFFAAVTIEIAAISALSHVRADKHSRVSSLCKLSAGDVYMEITNERTVRCVMGRA